MTTTDRRKTALAVLGQPDRNYAYHMAGLAIPYLALSYHEMDLIDATSVSPPEDADEEELAASVAEKRRLECEAAHHMLSRRLRPEPTYQEVYDTLNPDLFYGWVNDLLGGGKGELTGEREPPPAG